MPDLTSHQVSLHYERSGVAGGQPLILSSSLGATMALWEPQRTVFEQHFDLIRYDMRGHGQSSIPPGPYSIEMLAGDVLNMADSLALDNIIFCGISIGGAIGQWLAIHAPERFCGFVLSNTAAKIGTLEGWSQRIASVQQGGLEPLADRILSGWLTEPFRAAHPEIAAAMRQMLTACDPGGYISTCAAVRDFDFRDSLHRIQKPVCIVAGMQDASTTVTDAKLLHHTIAGSKLIELSAAHISNVEAANAFNDAIISFAQELSIG
jgi:3-oxoadipate enol-lactonase